MNTSVVSQKDRTVLWSVILSIALHVVLLVPGVKNLVPTDLFKVAEQPVFVEPLEFDLVSPPEQPIPTDQKSRYLSTVSSAASDLDPRDDGSALPKSEGVSPFPDTPSPAEGAEGGGKSELPPLPEEVGDLGEAVGLLLTGPLAQAGQGWLIVRLKG